MRSSLSHLPGEREALVRLVHDDIQNSHAGADPSCQIHGFCAVSSHMHLESGRLECQPVRNQQINIVVDQKDRLAGIIASRLSF